MNEAKEEIYYILRELSDRMLFTLHEGHNHVLGHGTQAKILLCGSAS